MSPLSLPPLATHHSPLASPSPHLHALHDLHGEERGIDPDPDSDPDPDFWEDNPGGKGPSRQAASAVSAISAS